MRINKYIANATGLSRRAADTVIASGRVRIDNQPATIGNQVVGGQRVTLDGKHIRPPSDNTTIMLNKPTGYVCSRDGQGSATIYQLLPPDLHNLKPIGRLDKDSSGLLILTDDGDLAQLLSHPRYEKDKVYIATLDKTLSDTDKQHIENGIDLYDGSSSLQISSVSLDQASAPNTYQVRLHQGRNRQIRRTFAALGYNVITLHRTHFGSYTLGNLPPGHYSAVC